MYLSKLELHAFKSFAHKTTLQFAPGITAIVGPNGCGKSNIIDAVRWVLGEQRARLLRSEKMENVIFNGTAKRRPLGMAEVSMTIENTHQVLPSQYTEVCITRRLYRSGESEYLLNGVPCRLRDIQELLMDTGVGANAYSVIELSMIEELLAANTQERRKLFEEAAGVTRYKTRRTQTQRKLDQLHIQLTRIRDLLAELEKQERSLSRQARKTEKWKALQEALKTQETQLLRGELTLLTREQTSLHGRLQEVRDTCTALETRIAEDEAALESLQQHLLDKELAASEAQRLLNACLDTLRKEENALQLHQQEMRHQEREIERLKVEEQMLVRRRSELEQELMQLKARGEELEPLLEKTTETFTELETRYQLLRQQHDAVRDRLAQEQQKEAHLERERQRWQEEQQAAIHRLSYIDEEREALVQRHHELLQQVEGLKPQLLQAEEGVVQCQQAIRQAEEALQRTRRQAAERRKSIEALRQEEQALSQHLESLLTEQQLLQELLQSHEGLSDAVQFLLTACTLPGTVLADVISCDPAYRAALEGALGPWLTALMAPREIVQEALQHLSTEEKGWAYFLTEPSCTPPPPTDISFGKPASAIFRPTQPTSTLADFLQRGWVVDSPEEAWHLLDTYASRYPWLWVVTREGTLFYPDGRVYGGKGTHVHTPAVQRIAHRERLKALTTEIQEITAQQQTVHQKRLHEQAILETLRVEEAHETLRQAEQAFHHAMQQKKTLEQELLHIQQQLQELQKRLQRLNEEKQERSEVLSTLSERLQQAEETLAMYRQKRRQQEKLLEQLATELQALQEAYTTARVDRIAQESTLTSIRKDLQRTESSLKHTLQRLQHSRKERSRLQRAIEESTQQIERLQKRMATLLEQRIEEEHTTQALQKEVLELRNQISEQEHHLRKLRRERETLLQELQRLQTRDAEIEARLALLYERANELSMEIPSPLPESEPVPDLHTLRNTLQELRERIRRLGAVNELALENYEEVRERAEFLRTQLQDLEEAERSLKKTIRTINQTASARFEETFAAIRTHFRELFRILFDGEGEADITLVEPDQPLESPIEITARPRGKKPVSLTQLSGGEKTLTAIALLFAIYLVKPSPFCILDEVDAPLDDANILRFMRLLRRFTEKTQFILVTHNKRTMEAADRLYGVTMQEEGVSIVVPVSFDRLELEPAETRPVPTEV